MSASQLLPLVEVVTAELREAGIDARNAQLGCHNVDQRQQLTGAHAPAKRSRTPL